MFIHCNSMILSLTNQIKYYNIQLKLIVGRFKSTEWDLTTYMTLPRKMT